MNKETALKLWGQCHDVLVDAYRLCASETEQGYDRESTRDLVDRAEEAEHVAWLCYREFN